VLQVQVSCKHYSAVIHDERERWAHTHGCACSLRFSYEDRRHMEPGLRASFYYFINTTEETKGIALHSVRAPSSNLFLILTLPDNQ
jgi:hypothetical protein